MMTTITSVGLSHYFSFLHFKLCIEIYAWSNWFYPFSLWMIVILKTCLIACTPIPHEYMLSIPLITARAKIRAGNMFLFPIFFLPLISSFPKIVPEDSITVSSLASNRTGLLVVGGHKPEYATSFSFKSGMTSWPQCSLMTKTTQIWSSLMIIQVPAWNWWAMGPRYVPLCSATLAASHVQQLKKLNSFLFKLE